MMRKTAISSAVLIGTLGITSVGAQEMFQGRSYVGASIGTVDVDDVAAVTGYGATIIVTGEDDSSTGWKIFGGYRLNQWLAAEAAYHNLGDVSIRGVGVQDVPLRAEADITGFSLSGVGTWPVATQLDVFGKAGVLAWDIKGSGINTDPNDDGFDLLIGAGLQYRVQQGYTIRGEWEWFNDVGGSDISMLSVGVALEF